MLLKVTAIIALFFFSVAEAQTDSAPVVSTRGVVLRQIFQDRGRAVAEGGDATVQEYVATFSDRSQCALKVVERKDNLVSLDISTCAKKAELQVQTLLEPSLFFGEQPAVSQAPVVAPDPLLMSPSAATPPPRPAVANPVSEEPSAVEREEEKVRISFGAGLGTTPKLTFDEARQPGYSDTAKVEMDLASGLSLSADIRVTPKNSWGFIGGVGYEGRREVKSLKVSNGGYSTTISGTASSTAASFTTWLYEANAVYRWDGWYLPFGLNYSYFQFKPTPQYTGGWEINGGMGFQLGVGYYLNRNLAIEFWSRATTISFRFLSNSVTTLDFGSGVYSSGFLAIRGIF